MCIKEQGKMELPLDMVSFSSTMYISVSEKIMQNYYMDNASPFYLGLGCTVIRARATALKSRFDPQLCTFRFSHIYRYVQYSYFN